MSNIPYLRQLRYMRKEMDARADDRTKMEEIKKKKEKKIRADDEKYNLFVQLLRTELLKRDIDISDKEFNQKLDEIITSSLSKFPNIRKRYIDANTQDIRNAVKRSINRERFPKTDDSMEK